MYENGFGVVNQQWLMCHKTKPNQTKPNQNITFIFTMIYKSQNIHKMTCYV